MSRLWKHRPSPAMIVATLALFVATGGTGYAVSKLPKGSVGSAQIRKNAVRSKHINAGSITKAKLAQSALGALRPPVIPAATQGASGSAASTSSGTSDRVAYADKAGLADRATLADRAGLADRATVADRATLADNASTLGGKSATAFLSKDSIRWIEPIEIGRTNDLEERLLPHLLTVGPFTLRARCTLDDTIGGIAGQDQADIIISTTQSNSAFDGEDLLGRLDPKTPIESRQFVNTAVAPTGSAKFEASSDGLAIGGDGKLYIKGSYLFASANLNGQTGTCKFGGYIFL